MLVLFGQCDYILWQNSQTSAKYCFQRKFIYQNHNVSESLTQISFLLSMIVLLLTHIYTNTDLISTCLSRQLEAFK